MFSKKEKKRNSLLLPTSDYSFTDNNKPTKDNEKPNILNDYPLPVNDCAPPVTYNPPQSTDYPEIFIYPE